MVVNSATVRKFLRDLAQHTKTESLNEAEAAARAAKTSGQDAIVASLTEGGTKGWAISIAGQDLTIFDKEGGYNIVSPEWSVILRPDYQKGLDNLQAELDGGAETQGTPDHCDAFGNQAAFYRDVTVLMMHGIPG